MRYPRVFWRLVPAALSLLVAVPLGLQAGGPGKGTFSKQPGGGIASLEAKFNLSQLMGEPMVAGVFKWEAEPGYSAKLPSDVVMWLKVRSGVNFAYISCAPVISDAGKGFGMDMTGSPDWKDVLVLEFSGKKAVRTMDASSAKHFWKAGFEVVDVVLSGAPPREGQAAQKGGASGNPSSASDSTKTANVLSTATAPTAAKPMGVATGGPAARTTSTAPPSSLSRLAPGILTTSHVGPPGSIPYRSAQPAPAAKPTPGSTVPHPSASTQVPGKGAPSAPSQSAPPAVLRTLPQQVPAPAAAPSRTPAASPVPVSVPRPQPTPAPAAGDVSRSSRPSTAPATASASAEAQRRQIAEAEAARKREAEAEAQRRRQAEAQQVREAQAQHAREAEAGRKREVEAEHRRAEAQKAKDAEAERRREQEATRRREQEEQRRREQAAAAAAAAARRK